MYQPTVHPLLTLGSNMMRPMIRTNAPIAPPATAGTGMEDLLLELTWPGSPVPEDMGEGVGITGGEVSLVIAMTLLKERATKMPKTRRMEG